jgi:hypothetical protein
MEIFKSILDCVIAVAAFVVGLSAVHKPFDGTFKGWSASLNHHLKLKTGLGIGLMALGVVYLFTAIYVPIEQKRDHDKEVAEQSKQTKNLQQRIDDGANENHRILLAFANSKTPIHDALSIIAELSPMVPVERSSLIDPEV